MLWASVFTTPFGLTEPLFVPEYWNPPSLFGLAQRTGFDVESLIFCFGIGGVSSVLYNVLTRRKVLPMPGNEKMHPRHRRHYLALAAPFLAFPVLYFLPWNTIYTGITSLFVGIIATLVCRPDLKAKMWTGGFIFLVYYTLLLTGMQWSASGYIERIWNLKALLGIELLGLPIEELLFAIVFGTFWSSVYEHFTWSRTGPVGLPGKPGGNL